MIARIARWAALAGVAALIAAGCGDDEKSTKTPQDEEAPPLPPSMTVSPDFAMYGATPKAAATQALFTGPAASPDSLGDCDTTMLNMTNALLRVVPVTSGIAAAVLPAGVALAGAATHTPTYSDGWFVYAYTVSYEGYEFDLEFRTAWNRAEKRILYEMYASTDYWPIVVDHWLWYDGDCDEDLTEGVWRFYIPALEDTNIVSREFLDSAWDWVSSEEMSVDFTVVATDTVLLGDSVLYDLDGDWATMVIADASSGLTGTTSIHVELEGGWCQFPNYRGGAKSCWDESGCDRACP